MKTLFTKIFKSIATFVTTHTTIAVTTAIILVAAAVAVPVAVYFAQSPSDNTVDISQGVSAPSEPTSEEPSEPTSEEPSEPNKTPTVVQNVDLKNGISWDGVSPIIYTYPDGTTGTEIRVGATYEVAPGLFTTVTIYHMPVDPSLPPKDLSVCDYCGKKGGDGSNGTCLRYWGGGDHVCKNCGETIPVKTCHTCND